MVKIVQLKQKIMVTANKNSIIASSTYDIFSMCVI